MARYAIVESGNVVSMIEWDGISEHPDSSKAILADDNAYVGGTYDGSSFSAAAQPADERTYAEKREAAYPKIGDQLDDLFHNGVFSDEMTTILQNVKDTYPKG